MDFSLYPFDAQKCLFAMTAQTDERSMERISPGLVANSKLEYFLIYNFLQKFVTTMQYEGNENTTESFKVDYRLTKKLSYWNHSLAGIIVSLTRVPYPFFINTYLPTTILTLISFIGFVIPVDKVPGRTALLVTVFLMLVNISGNERNRGPVVRFNNHLTNTLNGLKLISD